MALLQNDEKCGTLKLPDCTAQASAIRSEAWNALIRDKGWQRDSEEIRGDAAVSSWVHLVKKDRRWVRVPLIWGRDHAQDLVKAVCL